MKKIIKNVAFVSYLFLGFVSVTNASLVITSSQTVDVSGKYLPDNPPSIPDPRLDLSTSYNGNNTGGITQFDFNLQNKGIDEGSVLWDIGIEQARLRSLSDLRIKHNFSNSSQFTDLNVDVNSSISYGDTITVRSLNGSNPVPPNMYVRFQVDLTGNLFNTVNYANPITDGGASRADYFTDASFFSRIANSRGQANEDWQVESTTSTHANGFFDSNVNETANMNSSVVFEALLWRHQALFFDWTYSEMFKVDIQGIDVGSIDLQMKNDLSHTIVTRASVFDANGNWMPDFVVQSSEGFDYAQISAANPNPVNTPLGWITIMLFYRHDAATPIEKS